MTLPIKRGQIIPNFSLPTLQGQVVRRTTYRSKKHLVLVFIPVDPNPSTAPFLQVLIDRYNAIQRLQAEVLVIMGKASTIPQVSLTNLPFPLLLDSTGKTSAQFSNADAEITIFVTDRYGELYYTASVADGAEMALVSEIESWLQAIDYQCAV